ncbi:hypothetical protein Hanom_Chr03g00232361 [Helianthus anomalus]
MVVALSSGRRLEPPVLVSVRRVFRRVKVVEVQCDLVASVSCSVRVQVLRVCFELTSGSVRCSGHLGQTESTWSTRSQMWSKAVNCGAVRVRCRFQCSGQIPGQLG